MGWRIKIQYQQVKIFFLNYFSTDFTCTNLVPTCSVHAFSVFCDRFGDNRGGIDRFALIFDRKTVRKPVLFPADRFHLHMPKILKRNSIPCCCYYDVLQIVGLAASILFLAFH